MSVRVVAGYVRLDSGHRPHARFVELAGRLLDIGLPLTIYTQQLRDCWLHRYHAEHGTIIEPGGKDTPAYHCVQHEKTAWLCREAEAWRPTTVVWVDIGILHLPAVRPQHIADYVAAVAASPPDRITAPSCHPVPDVVAHGSVCWAFCGGVLAVPASDAEWFQAKCFCEAVGSPLTWEVNTWAKVAQRHPERFRLYPADHDERLFTGLHQ